MKKFKKVALVFILSIFFIAAVVPTASAKTETKPPLNYVAMGDSIAAGVIFGTDSFPNGKSTLGYTNNLMGKLEGAGFTVGFNNDFCNAGKTAHLLALDSADFNDENSYGYALVHNAQLVTLDIGANDLLGGFYDFIAPYSEILKNYSPGSDLPPALVEGLKNVLKGTIQDLYFGSTGKKVQQNIEIILQNILNANPNAQIYVMGYYNPLPELKKYGMDLTLPVIYFNTFIYKAICNVRARNRNASISYIDTMVAMSNGVNRGLLYPVDIHPTVQGYKVIADQFWQRIKVNYLVSKLLKTLRR